MSGNEYTAQDFYDDIARVVRQELSSTPNPWTKLAVIDPAYTSGLPKVQWEGELDTDDVTPVLSEKQYPYLSSYNPTAGDRVVLQKVNGSWIILGGVVGP